jgi:hypothetical protein
MHIRSINTSSNNRTKHQPSQYQAKRPSSAMAYRLSEKITPNKELMLMRSDVAIGMALSHGNVNAMM